MVDDDGLYDFVHMCLARHLVLYLWNWHQCWAKANGQIIRVHHVLVTVLGKTVKGSKEELVKRGLGKENAQQDTSYFTRKVCVCMRVSVCVCTHLCVCTHEGTGAPMKGIGHVKSPELQVAVSHLMWVLGFELISYGRVAHTQDGAISSAPLPCILKTWIKQLFLSSLEEIQYSIPLH